MRQTVLVREVEETDNNSDSGLSKLSRAVLKAATFNNSVSPEADALARNETRAALHKALEPSNRLQYEYRNYGSYSILEAKR